MNKKEDILVIIPARGGSKGIPYKNIKPLNGKPLIHYAIDQARAITTDDNICVSTDDDKIIDVVESYGLKVPFKRPDYLATDTCGTYDVLLHAISFYAEKGREYKTLILLQTTSPFRSILHVKEALELYNDDVDMVVGVKDASHNYYVEKEDGYLSNIRGTSAIRRQDIPKIWTYNGAIYVINIDSLKKHPMSKFSKIRKYVMDDYHSIDLDTMFDWKVAELMIKEREHEGL